MKKVIFTQDWVAMHPYEKPNEVDQYYTELANEIYHALDDACFTHQFKDVEDAKQLALCIAGYFEDVLSGTCIWKTFTAECKKRYGSYIPFYENEKEFVKNSLNVDDAPYDPDEINISDIKFLCWHHYQQSTYIQEAVPFLFSTMTLAAKLAYNLLDKEYETAPENERLIAYLSEMPVLESQNEEEEKQLDEIHRRDTLAWFHYGCYFNVGNRQRLQLVAAARGQCQAGAAARQFMRHGRRPSLMANRSTGFRRPGHRSPAARFPGAKSAFRPQGQR